MAKIENSDLNYGIKIRGIEVIKESLQVPTDTGSVTKNFNYTIGIESKADATNKLVFVIVHVEVKNDAQSVVLGALSVSCIYEIANFEEVIKVKDNGKLDMPQSLIETLNTLSVSTTRGLMFSTFRGTFLHGAILPIIDLK